jgi:phosphoribosylanthranilate isomerase
MRHLRVKVCGITCLDDALWAADAGADALGLIFVEGTPRYVAPAVAAAIVAGLPPLVCPVGVFWDQSPDSAPCSSTAPSPPTSWRPCRVPC